MNTINNHVFDHMFSMLDNRNLLSLSMTSRNMMIRVRDYLKRTGRASSLKLLELSHKLRKTHDNSKKWSMRPQNNNNSNSSSGSSVRRLVF